MDIKYVTFNRFRGCEDSHEDDVGVFIRENLYRGGIEEQIATLQSAVLLLLVNAAEDGRVSAEQLADTLGADGREFAFVQEKKPEATP